MNTTELLEQENEEQIICDKQIKIYHIRNVKVGSSCRLETRIKQQGYQVDDCEVLATIEANTLTYREVWETEQDYAVMKGFETENEGNWATFYNTHTKNVMNDPAVRAKVSESFSKSYDIYTSGGVWVCLVADPVGYAKKHNLNSNVLTDAANPNNTQKWFHIDGVPHTARVHEGTSPKRIEVDPYKAMHRSYVVKALDGVVVAEVSDAAGYEQTNGLARGALKSAANPKNNRRFITLNGIKHIVAYKK